MGKKVELKAEVSDVYSSDVHLEFGRTQAHLSFSSRGSIQRKLKLKKGSKVKVIIIA